METNESSMLTGLKEKVKSDTVFILLFSAPHAEARSGDPPGQA
jgi:hypothetical protein